MHMSLVYISVNFDVGYSVITIRNIFSYNKLEKYTYTRVLVGTIAT